MISQSVFEDIVLQQKFVQMTFMCILYL